MDWKRKGTGGVFNWEHVELDTNRILRCYATDGYVAKEIRTEQSGLETNICASLHIEDK